MSEAHTFVSPALYVRTKTGVLNQWRSWAHGDQVHTEWGQVGGKLQLSAKTAIPTNVGRSNERDGVAQAVFEAKALWQNKVDGGYTTDSEKAKSGRDFPPHAGSQAGLC